MLIDGNPFSVHFAHFSSSAKTPHSVSHNKRTYPISDCHVDALLSLHNPEHSKY